MNNKIESTDNRIGISSSILRKITKKEELGVLLGVILICVIITCINPRFVNLVNLTSIFENIAYIMIAATAMTLVMITGSFDMSVGAIMAFSSCIAALLMVQNVSVPISILISLIACGFFGLLNGTLIVKLGIPSFVTTLGTMYIARGIVQAITKGEPIYPLPESFSVLGNGMVFGLPLCFIIMLVLAFVTGFVLKKTTYGRSLYAIGGNLEAAKLSGLPIDKIRVSVYVLCSIAAGLSGLIMTSKMSSAQISLGTGWEMKIIASVVIGGTSMMGGTGTVLGTFLGAALMTIIYNGMVLMRISVYWQSIFIGAIIIIAVAVDILRRKRAGIQ